MNTSTPIRLRVVCLALMAVYPMLSYAGVAGRVQFVAGDVRVVDAQGRERALRKGEELSEGDTVRSAAGASAQLKMIDGAVVAVRPDTQLKITGYVFNGQQDGSENASFSLVKGGLRAITGLIGKVNKDKYKIETPTAVIGIRGTDHEPVVVLPATAAGMPPGTYDKVNVGATSLTNQAGTTVVGANQVGFAASPTQRPTLLPKVPDFYRATPAPAQGKKQEQEQRQEQKQKQEQKQAANTPAAEHAATSDSAAGDTAASAAPAPAPAPAVSDATLNAVSGATILPSSAPAVLTATDASGATLDLSNQTVTPVGGGTVALTPGTSLSANTALIATYPFNDPNNHPHPDFYNFSGPTQSVARDAAGNVTGVADNGAYAFGSGYRASLSQSGSVMTDAGRDAVTGLSWGRWQGGQVTQTSQYFGTNPNGQSGLGAVDASGTFVVGGVETRSSALGSASLHWIAGSGAAPDYLPKVLTGTATYTLIGGTHPTDLLGRSGTLNSASLAVNFTSQQADASVNFSIGSDNWNMQSSGMQLRGSSFSSYSNCTVSSCTSSVSLSKNGAALSTIGTPTAGSAFGSMNGTLTGLGLNGAGLQYAVQEAVPTSVDPVTGQTYFTDNVIQGVAAFSAPAQDTQTPFRAVGVSDGWGRGMDGFNKNSSTSTASGLYRGSVDGGEAPAARVAVDSAGGMTEFLGRAFDYAPLSAATAPASPYDGTPAAIRIGSATNQDVGSLTVNGTTVSWGRWEGGTIDIYSRDGSVKLGTIDNSGRSLHWVASPVMTSDAAFASLPLTGTATYAVAGGTRPTDLLGNVGTLTSATLTADFSNAKVAAGVNVSFNAPTNTSSWSMNAANVPLRGGNGFESSTVLNGVNGISHSTSCSGTTCGPQTVGNINGVFFGGGQGAVVMYGMSTGTTTTTAATATSPASTTFNPSNAVSGVVVMKR